MGSALFPKLPVTKTLKGLTIHAPWAWAILQGYKRVENRSWVTSHRGRLAIHAGQSKESDERALASFRRLGIEFPKTFSRGVIWGTVQLMDVVPLEEYLDRFGEDPMDREFAIGPYCWILSEPEFCDPIKCAGNFQLWNVWNQLQRQ